MPGVLLAAGSAVYLYPILRVLWRVGDEGSLVHGAQRLLEGDLPYRDFFEVMGPGSFYWLGLFFQLFGTSFLVARVVLLLTWVLITVLLYWLTRRLYEGPGDMLPAVYCLLVSLPLWPGANHHWDSNLFFLLGFAAFLLWQDQGRRGYLCLAGMLAGLTSCFLQQKGLLLFLALALVLVAEGLREGGPRSRLVSDLGLLAAGYGGVGAAVALYFFLAGGLPDLVYANLIWPLKRYHRVNVMPYGYFLVEHFWPFFQGLWRPFMPAGGATLVCLLTVAPLALLLALPGVMAAVAAAGLIRPGWRSRLWSPALLPYWAAGFALWLSELHRPDLYHLVYGAPLLLILAFVVPALFWPGHNFLKALMVSAVGGGLLLLGWANLMVALHARLPVETRRGAVYLWQPDDSLNFLLSRTQPGEEVFIYPYYPMYYFLAGVRNPTRYSILVYHINTETQFAETIERLEVKRVKYVLWDTRVENKTMAAWFPNYQAPAEEDLALERYLTKNYTVLGVQNGFRILERRETAVAPPAMLPAAPPGHPPASHK